MLSWKEMKLIEGLYLSDTPYGKAVISRGSGNTWSLTINRETFNKIPGLNTATSIAEMYLHRPHVKGSKGIIHQNLGGTWTWKHLNGTTGECEMRWQALQHVVG